VLGEQLCGAGFPHVVGGLLAGQLDGGVAAVEEQRQHAATGVPGDVRGSGVEHDAPYERDDAALAEQVAAGARVLHQRAGAPDRDLQRSAEHLDVQR
jgi:hypothetical protein